MDSLIRVLYVATNDAAALSSAVPELVAGPHPVDKIKAEELSRALAAVGIGASRTHLIRRQYSAIAWNLFHDPYDPKPQWLC